MAALVGVARFLECDKAWSKILPELIGHTKPLMGDSVKGMSFIPKIRKKKKPKILYMLPFCKLETATRKNRARELPANRLGVHFMHAYSEGWKEARPFLQPLTKILHCSLAFLVSYLI